MEYRKKNWNSLLNNFIASTALIILALLIGIMFVPIKTNAAGTISRDTLKDYNVQFTSAITKSRSATGLNKISATNHEGNTFYTYSYNYNTYSSTKLYNGTNGVVASDGDASLSLTSGDTTGTINTMFFTPISNTGLPSAYIPMNANYFDNVDGEKENLFGNEIGNGDFVLLNNYTSHNETNDNDNNFNVENIYLSFGAPNTDSVDTTLLYNLKVTAKLYSTYIDKDGNQIPIVHDQLVINEVYNYSITDNKIAMYWSQYLDLRELTAYNEEVGYYSVDNLQGKYEFTFTFTRYDDNLVPLSSPTDEVFQYTFYLLDSAEYTDYPTVNNGKILNDLNKDEVNEYYYNFTTDSPYISYDPTKYNVSYTRANNQSSSNLADAQITSNFVSQEYTFEANDNRKFVKGILTYYNGSTKFKEVFILINFNGGEGIDNGHENRTIVEYLYLSRSNIPANDTYNPTSYNVFESGLENGTLKFEYKLTTLLEQNENEQKYTLTTYKTTNYDNHSLTSDFSALDKNKLGEFVESQTYTNSNSKISLNGNDEIATFGSYASTDNKISSLMEENGIILNSTTLETAEEVSSSNYQYKIVTNTADTETTYTLIRTYESDNKNVEVEIFLPITNTGKFTIKDDNIVIDYIVEEKTTEGENPTTHKEITSVIFSNKTLVPVSNLSPSSNQKILNEIIDIIDLGQVPIRYSYELQLKELGIYNFKYSYVCPADNETYYINSTNEATSTLSYSSSVNFTTPVDYAIVPTSTDLGSQVSEENTGKPLYITISKELSVANKATYNGIEYEYNPTTNTISLDGQESTEKTQLGPYEVNVIYNVETVANKNILNIIYQIGTITTSTKTNIYSYSLDYTFGSKEHYRVLYETITTHTYSLSDANSAQITSSAFDNFPLLASIQEIIKTFETSYTPGNNTYIQQIKDTNYEETTQGQDKLHIFGSITYFNKANSTTDSGYAKLEQIDSKEHLNYVADVTSLFYDTYTYKNDADTDFNPSEYYSSTYNLSQVANDFKGKIATLLDRDSIIVTDVTPVLWNNFSTLAYNGKSSCSYIYRYTDYSFNDDGSIDLTNASCQISTYSKDVYCQFDGLYEIVVFYKYANLPVNCTNNVYYQVFTFIIDNSSPTLNILVNSIEEDKTIKKDLNGNIVYEELGLNKYTNRNVRLTWEVPTYFQNDIYVEIVKSNFNGSSSYDAIFKFGNISSTGINSNLVSQVTSMGKMQITDEAGKVKNYYYVDIADPESLSDDAESLINGNYKIIMHYNAGGKSTFTEEFIIDKQDISGLNIRPIVKNLEGVFSVPLALPDNYNEDSQIINTDFTFRFDRKESNANIYVYYDKIPLSSYSNYDKIITASDGFGLTTKSYVDGDNITIGTQYVYEYTHENNPYNVDNKNVLISNSSCIYLFRLTDEAGNECRYVVFYDTTEPRFLTSPDPDPVTHVVNSTTRVVWGDYKAIKVLSDTSRASDSIDINDFNVNKYIDNYDYTPDSPLQLVLRYLNSDSIKASETGYKEIFNGLKVERIEETLNGQSVNNYYILVPIKETTIEDNEYNKDVEISGYTEYYFFPTNPVIEIKDENQNTTKRQITLPQFDSNGKAVLDSNKKVLTKTFEIVGEPKFTTRNDFDGNIIQRYVEITYYTTEDKTSTATIIGAIGEGRFLYSVSDDLGNQTSGLIWMNLDRTQTIAYGLFDYSEDLKNAEPFINTEGSFSASKMFISSLTSTKDNNIPNYTVSYKQFGYDIGLYKDYKVTSISYEVDSASKASYLKFQMQLNTDSSVVKTINVQLTDEDGNNYPKVSYPYSLDGGEEVDAYAEGFSYLNNDTTRKYSLAISTTTDTNKQKVVTEEGLYVFKREYTANAEQFADLQDSTSANYVEGLETDKRIIYRVYYIDRSGIINITTNSTTANKLYSIGSSIGFTLGSDYAEQDKNYKEEITAESIQNNQKSSGLSYSNSDYISSDLFDTNKVLVEFTRSYDKHDFEQFSTNNLIAYQNLVNSTEAFDEETKAFINKQLENYIFNEDYFSNKMYRVELDISIDNSTIINEARNYYSASGISAYLTNKNRNTSQSPIINKDNRATEYYFYYDIPSYSTTSADAYVINLNDQSGHDKFNADGTVADDNYLSNNLKITFDISHDAPDGEFYGKYYGRENYDENYYNSSTGSSIPIGPNNEYAILTEYLNGQLDPLTKSLSITNNSQGEFIELYSTNNETLIFTFSITNDKTQAQIDPDNIKIYKGGTADSNLILNRVDGDFLATSLTTVARQKNSFVINTINNTVYYAIIIFDNNLDQILDDKEKELYGDFRLLDAEQNIDKETYYVKINYVGDKNNYKGADIYTKEERSYYQTTYEIDIDRIKPTYNLTKLMSLDKYTYNNISTKVTSANYEQVFEQYKSFYNFQIDPNRPDMDYERSDIEKYFFALDYREDSTFVFESVSTHDNNSSFYIRKVDKDNYKFSVTPDDYQAYYTTEYLTGHPQFTPSSAVPIDNDTYVDGTGLTDTSTYYRIEFNSFDGEDDGKISANYLYSRGIFKQNEYYEIIEVDEAGNYRVYAVYIPQQETNSITYTYQKNSNLSSLTSVTISKGNNPYSESKGMNLEFNNLVFKDNFLRANLNIVTRSFNHLIDIILNPNTLTVTVINRTTGEILLTLNCSSKDKYIGSTYCTNTDAFMEAINYTLNYYYERINNKSDSYYSEYGYDVQINIIDRLGVKVANMNRLYDYEISYVVAGSTLSPIFIDNQTNFIMRLEGQKGSTYLANITDKDTNTYKPGIVVYKFNKGWVQISYDNSTTPQSFNKSDADLKKPIDYVFTRGVYKFVFTDNFNRTLEFYHEFGISSSQTGGSLNFYGDYATLDDGYTYSSNVIEYTYDSSVYNVYIKFTGKIPSEYETGLYDTIDEVIYKTNNTNYTNEYLSYYGLSILTSGNTTIIRFTGVKDSTTSSGVTDLSKYHIKTVLASTSDSYEWGAEENNAGDAVTNTDILVYDKKIARYNAIQNVGIKNLSGTTLDTSEHLNLTEDFELVTMWNSSVDYSERFDFNSRIILTRKYNDNGTIKTTTTNVKSGQIISLPGEYTAYVINDLGMTCEPISFTRGEGEISMYAVYAVNATDSTEKNLSPSSLVSTTEEDNKVLFTYFITNDYFSYKDNEGNIVTMDNISNYYDLTNISSVLSVNTSANKYLDVRVNSNLSIRAEIHKIGVDEFGYPYVEYTIYSKTQNDEIYTYRYIQIIFVNISDTNLTNVKVTNYGDASTNLAETSPVITSTASSIKVQFTFLNEDYSINNAQTLTPYGDTLYLERYYNGKLVETTTLSITSNNVPEVTLDITTVGLHEFVLKDLAGRTHKFNNSSETLQIYLINQILYTINNENPINNQIFNDDVNIDIVFELSGLQLYNQRSLNIVITKNGQETNIPNNEGHFTISESGFYTVRMSATTLLANGNATQISSTYNFVIIDDTIATRSFSLSKGTGFILEKIVKIINGEKIDITATYHPQVEQVDVYAEDKSTILTTLNNGQLITVQNFDESSEYTKITYKSSTSTIEGYIKTKYIQMTTTQSDGNNAKIVNSSNTLLWLTHGEQGNSIFDVTLKYYEQVSKSYRSFNFRVWINDETPNIISSIPNGTSTKDTISVNYNPGLIYTQIGKGYITLNDNRVAEIDATSPQAVETITISQKGTYWIKIYSENGTLISAYKFVKNEPINNITKIILVCVAIGIVVVAALFFLLRRKGKYR